METVESLFLNPLKEVQKFFEKYHKDHYKIYNLSNAQTHTYSHDKFHQVTRIPVPDQGVPSLLVSFNYIFLFFSFLSILSFFFFFF